MDPVIMTGTDDFGELLLESAVFVDKSLFVKEFLEKGNKVVLLTRPRRWGKSMNMSMLGRFLAIEVDEQGVPLPEEECFNRKLFAGGEVDLGFDTNEKKQLQPLRISEHKEIMARYQGKFPVISVGLKEIDGSSYETVEIGLKRAIAELFDKYGYLENQPWLTRRQRQELDNYLSGNISTAALKDSLKFLSELLQKHFGKPVYLLIDEYDTPIHDIYLEAAKEDPAELKKVLKLFKGLFGAALKSNPHLKKGLVTGILRIAKAGLFSGLNNPSECTLLDEPFCSSYGFTEEEVVQMMTKTSCSTKLEEIRRWYNGYTLGGQSTRIYNPWSIMNCLENSGKLDHYWIDSGGTALVNQALLSDGIQVDLQALVAGKSIEVPIMKQISFDDITSRPGLFSLLLFTGYLNPDEGDAISGLYKLSIPNFEVRNIYEQRLLKWLAQKLQVNDKELFSLMSLLAAGEIEKFEEELRTLLAVAASFFQTGKKNGEVFYNGFMFCLLTVLSAKYTVESERESGAGRPDVMLIPKVDKGGEQAFVIEYKVSKELENLEAEAKSGLAQIIEKNYTAKAKEHVHVKSILQVSMAFCGKDVALAYKESPCCNKT